MAVCYHGRRRAANDRPRLDSSPERLKQYERVTTNLPQVAAAPGLDSIDLRRLSWTARFLQDYCYDFDRLSPFFVGSPADPDTWRLAIAERQNRSGTTRPIADVATRQLTARGAPPEALASAARLRNAETVSIVTGQQAGLFGGPLFTLLKALTAIKLARQVTDEHGVPAVPVFWVDAEDHDLAEISTCTVLTSDLDHRSVSLSLGADANQPASAVELPASVTDVVAELRTLLPTTEFSDGLFTRLSAAYRPGVGIVDAFTRWLELILGPHGLVVFDASDGDAKSLAQSIFIRELEVVGQTSHLAATAGDELSRLGYHAQVTPTPDAVSLFSLDGGRNAIRRHDTDDDAFRVGGASQSAVELRRLAEHEPNAFSPNVLLRPVVQDALFPTVAYVSGPSELAYLGQLRQVYDHFDVPMPIIYPRATATIVDRSTLKFLARYPIGFEHLQAQDDSELNRLLASLLPTSVEEAIVGTEQAVASHLTAVANEISAVDPTLEGAVDTTRGKMERDIRTLRGKIVQAAKRRDETLRRQFQRARNQAFPGGDPQERSVSLLYFLNRYGDRVVDRLLADLPLELGQHYLLTV